MDSSRLRNRRRCRLIFWISCERSNTSSKAGAHGNVSWNQACHRLLPEKRRLVSLGIYDERTSYNASFPISWGLLAWRSESYRLIFFNNLFRREVFQINRFLIHFYWETSYNPWLLHGLTPLWGPLCGPLWLNLNRAELSRDYLPWCKNHDNRPPK